MEITKENKRIIYIVIAIIVVLFVLAFMLKFWLYTAIAIGCFGAGFYYGSRYVSSPKEGKKRFL